MRLTLSGSAASLVFLLAACTDPAYLGSPVRVASETEVANCTYVTSYRTRPGVYGPLASQGLEDARRTTLESAAEAGANTVVFAPIPADGLVTEIEADAYVC